MALFIPFYLLSWPVFYFPFLGWGGGGVEELGVEGHFGRSVNCDVTPL